MATKRLNLIFIQPATAQTAKLDSLAVSFVMTASRDMTIKLWDAIKGRCLWTFVSAWQTVLLEHPSDCMQTKVGHDNWVQALAFNPSGNNFLSAADDNSMRLWDLRTGRCIRNSEILRAIFYLVIIR